MSRDRQRGFTLVEAVVVIVITGILAGIVAVFITRPVEGYMDAVRRAELTDAADTALRRIARDLRLALPNSVVVTSDATSQTLTYVPTTGGGRYRAEGEDRLDFTQADTTFDVLGPAVTFAGGESIVVYNLGVPGADAYGGGNRASYGGAAGSVTNVAIGAKKFPFESPSQRFQVVQGPVSYVCSPTGTGGDGTLRRYSYAFDTTPMLSGGPQLAGNVSACSLSYTPGVTERSGLVVMTLTLTQDGESVTLVHQVHASNVP